MKRRIMLIALLLPVLAGCVSYVQPLGPTNPTMTDAKQGQDCRDQFGIGGIPDVTGAQAIRSGRDYQTTKHRASHELLFRRRKGASSLTENDYLPSC